ncbi:hypothetical protein UFOVP1419_31 [uncultured Caudovirales phage]|uniref:Uncharacterized protein n=1 Tax=uncultured Caudovirales phage TaxID=2100421 RepID=A0A6J5SE18_9CAUD|nr:hypothetical protein UFOVP1419_31 [uncultured Caudovirales phage]
MKRFRVNYEIVQLVLLGLIIVYGIALLAGLAIPVENKEAFAGVYSVILLLLSVSNLQKRIETNGDTTVNIPDNTGKIEVIPKGDINANTDTDTAIL